MAVALVATILLGPLFPYPFLFLFFGAVMVSAWFAGLVGGFLAVLVSTLLIDYFFVPPLHSFAVSASVEAYFIAFVLCSLVATWLSSQKRKNEEALRNALDQMEARVSERTAELMKTQAELSHLSQVLSMGELAASIAHEINQPLTAVVANGHACVEWLSASPPNLEKTRQTVERIIQEGTRAGAVLGRIRALFKKEAAAREWLDMNEVIHELVIFVREEAARQHIAIRTDLSPSLPKVKGDRVQLQQVVLNLVMNGLDAMTETLGRPPELLVTTRREGTDVVVQVEDSGTGLDAESLEKIFHPFFTTKPHGIGMGLSISRSIIEAHDGQLTAMPRPAGGAIFQFELPAGSRESDE